MNIVPSVLTPIAPLIGARARDRRRPRIAGEHAVDRGDRRRAAAIIARRDDAFGRAGQLADVAEEGAVRAIDGRAVRIFERDDRIAAVVGEVAADDAADLVGRAVALGGAAVL